MRVVVNKTECGTVPQEPSVRYASGYDAHLRHTIPHARRTDSRVGCSYQEP